MTTLGRKSSVTVDDNLRTYEQNLLYLENSLKGFVDMIVIIFSFHFVQILMNKLIVFRIPCEKLFFASWEQIRHSPEVFISPLTEFLELTNEESKQVIILIIIIYLLQISELTLSQGSYFKYSNICQKEES